MSYKSTKFLFLPLLLFIFGFQNNETIDSYLTNLNQHGKLNGNVLVVKEGKTVYERSFGYADGTKKMLLNKDYRFNMGSVYKEFPAVSIMQLQEKGLLKLDDTLFTYINGLPAWSKKITIKNLLQYSSGLPSIDWGAYFSKGIRVTDQDIMDNLINLKSLEFEPGSDYLYSNNNPILLIKIVETITNMSFSEYLQKNILTPYHMDDTVIKEQYPYKDKTRMTIPFNEAFEEDQFKLAVTGLLFSSTARDMSQWFQQLDSFTIISKKSMQILSETAKAGDNIQSPLGYTQWKNTTITQHAHHGSSGNYECLVKNYKPEAITIVVLTNQKNGNVHEIVDTIYNMVQ